MKKWQIFIIIIFFIVGSYLYYTLNIDYYNNTNYAIKLQATPSTIKFENGETSKVIRVIIENNSRNVISSDNNIFLSYHIVDAAGKTIKFDNERTKINMVSPYGKSEPIDLTVYKENPKGYIIQVDLVKEDVTWFSEKGMLTTDIKVTE